MTFTDTWKSWAPHQNEPPIPPEPQREGSIGGIGGLIPELLAHKPLRINCGWHAQGANIYSAESLERFLAHPHGVIKAADGRVIHSWGRS